MTNVYLKSQVELWINLYQAVKLTHFFESNSIKVLRSQCGSCKCLAAILDTKGMSSSREFQSLNTAKDCSRKTVCFRTTLKKNTHYNDASVVEVDM